MLAFILFLVIMYLLAVLAVTLPYWYETGNTPCEDIPAGTWSLRGVIRLWLDAAWTALFLGIAFPLDPVLRRMKKKDGTDPDDLPPVLLVHGLYHTASGWMFLRSRLDKAGFRKIHTFGYSSRKTDIAAITAGLDAAVADVERRYPGKKPLLVGHSLGGLVLRNWLAKEENQEHALGVVTLGAPHRGSKMAALAIGKLGRSLMPSNTFFEDLARTEKPASIPCVSLASEADTMVLPQSYLVPVTKGWELKLTPYATHVGLLVKGAVLRMTVWELHRIVAAAQKNPDEVPAEAGAGNVAAPAHAPEFLESATETTPAPEVPEVSEKPAEPKAQLAPKAGTSAAKAAKKKKI